MEKRRGGNGGQKDFQKTEGKVLDSYVWCQLGDVSSIRTAST